jgi:ankyrin repeat protein
MWIILYFTSIICDISLNLHRIVCYYLKKSSETNMTQYNHKQPVLLAPTAAPKRGKFGKKLMILLLAAVFGSVYYKANHWHNGVSSSGFFHIPTSPFSSKKPSKNANFTEATAAPLLKAASDGNEKEVQNLLKTHPPIDGRDKKQRTALMLAAFLGQNTICNLLIASGANINLQDNKGQTALDYAASRGFPETVKLLSEKNAVNTKANKHNLEYAMIMQAAFTGDISLLPKTEEKISSINRLSVEGRSALHIAVSNGALELAKELLKRGANVNLANNSAQTPLHFAAWGNKSEIIALLLDNSARINEIDKSGNTSLMFAVSQDNKEAVQMLLNKGANKNLHNKNGENAASIAHKKNFKEISALLSQERK